MAIPIQDRYGMDQYNHLDLIANKQMTSLTSNNPFGGEIEAISACKQAYLKTKVFL